VRSRLEALGVPTIDADTLARQVVAAGAPAFEAIVRRFGSVVVDEGGGLNRQALGQIVFTDAEARRDLEAIVHPLVRDAIERWFDSLQRDDAPFGVAVIPLLFETGRDQDFDVILVTACNPQTQLQRVISRDGLSETDARRRIAAQLPQDDKVAHADTVIGTDGSLEDTDRQVEAWVESACHSSC
jgi:dephospho-CoA kinase